MILGESQGATNLGESPIFKKTPSGFENLSGCDYQ